MKTSRLSRMFLKHQGGVSLHLTSSPYEFSSHLRARYEAFFMSSKVNLCSGAVACCHRSAVLLLWYTGPRYNDPVFWSKSHIAILVYNVIFLFCSVSWHMKKTQLCSRPTLQNGANSSPSATICQNRSGSWKQPWRARLTVQCHAKTRGRRVLYARYVGASSSKLTYCGLNKWIYLIALSNAFSVEKTPVFYFDSNFT